MFSLCASNACRAVRLAGLYPSRFDLEQILGQLDTFPSADLSHAVVHEKVSSLLLQRLREHKPALVARLSAYRAFTEARARIDTIVHHKAAVLDLIGREAQALGIEVWAVKGLAAQRAYQDPDLRDLGDLDLMVDGVDAAIRLTDRLIASGYNFHSQEWPWIKRCVESGVIYGQFSLKHVAPERPPAIDLLFGGYSVRHCGLHPLTATRPRPGLSYYGTQANLPLIVGNAAGDHDITTKDLNDLAIAIEDPAVDWAAVLDQLDQVRLLGFFRRMIDELEATPARAVYRDSALRMLLPAGRREVPAPHPSWPRQRRWAVTVQHAFAVGARHSYIRAGITSLTAAHYYWGDRTIKMRPRPSWSRSRLPRLNSWTCVRLIPATLLRQPDGQPEDQPRFLPTEGDQHRLSAELTAIRSPAGDIIRTALGDFVPAVYGVGTVGRGRG